MLKNKIFFSIIIPTYNHAFFLDKALKSVAQQTFKNYEVIVIDNFSKDNTAEIVRKYKKYCNIEYKKIYNYGVIGKSRNFGIKNAKGNWLAFLDSDDFWYPEKLKVIFRYIKNNINYEIFCNNEILNNDITKSHSNYGPFVNNFYKNLLIKGNCVSTSGSVLNKNFLIKKKIFFSEKKSFVTAEDYDFFLNLAKAKGNFFFIKDFLGEHNYYDGSASSDYFFHRKAVISVLKYHIYSFTFKDEKKKMISHIFFNIHFNDMIYFFKKKSIIKFLNVFLNLFLINPFNLSFLIIKKFKNLYRSKFIY